MKTPLKARRFRFNPVEVAIFAIVAATFAHSVYSLFNDRNGFAALAPMASNSVPEARQPASVDKQARFEFKCEGTVEEESKAGLVQLKGTFCDLSPVAKAKADSDDEGTASTASEDAAAVAKQAADSSSSPAKLEVRVTNTSLKGKPSPLVFFSDDTKTFSTEWFQLNPGKNVIQVEFVKDGKTIQTKEMTISKN